MTDDADVCFQFHVASFRIPKCYVKKTLKCNTIMDVCIVQWKNGEKGRVKINIFFFGYKKECGKNKNQLCVFVRHWTSWFVLLFFISCCKLTQILCNFFCPFLEILAR
jgi:hypothetical protein